MILSSAVLLWLLACAFFPHLLAPADPLAVHPARGFLPPSPAAILGTDESGRGVYTRIVHGAAASLSIGAGATALGIVLGTLLGTMAGLGPRWLDFGTSRLLEVLFAFPGLLLALLFIVVYGPGGATSAIAVGLATAPGYARIIRSQMITVRQAPYVEALVVLGRGPWHRFWHSILPNVAEALFALVTLGVGQSIVWASSLSFLGLGTPPPAAEWGAMLADGRTYLGTAWWMTFFPGLVIVLAAAACTVLGRRLQGKARRS
ncbi:MAG TPA: ABC transporter permease [Microbacteriaceae bacterium]|nr:ABC transporter permease [Microbacteriaceae bacterium]